MQPHPELFMAARHGDCVRLKQILATTAPVALPSQVVIDVAEANCTLRTDGTVNIERAAALITAAEAVTTGWDSVLHVVASSGDGDEFLQSAAAIYGVASHLLAAGNKKGDTPLHCAVRAGKVEMVSHLLKLARGDGAGDAAAKAAVRMQNGKGETALHEAARLGDKKMIAVLLSADSQLARVVAADGTSPLYLAVWMGHDDIARQLHGLDEALSYSGPDGKNALHAAVLKTEETTRMILDWNKKDLIKQTERSTGSTPLHFAASGAPLHLGASLGKHDVISLLLAADPSAAYQQDKNGSFPIHLAAFAGTKKAVQVLLEDSRRDCAELRDGRGRSFLHVAVEEENTPVVYACSNLMLPASVMNMQDDDGNTALHLAVKVGNMWIFDRLMGTRQVNMNLTNNEGQTPLDLSIMKMPLGVRYRWNPMIYIYNSLLDAGAQIGTHSHRPDLFRKNISKLDETEEAKKITESTQTIGIGSVVIATVAFAAAFALPGGYRADDHKMGGAPTLAGHYAFEVFIIANTLAFICSGLSIATLIFAGVAPVKIFFRRLFFVASVTLMAGSARSLGAAFAFGLYVVLAPVAPTTAIAACVITGALALVDAYCFFWVVVMAMGDVVLPLKRHGVVRALLRLLWAILFNLALHFWPYIVIAGVLTYSKIKRVH